MGYTRNFTEDYNYRSPKLWRKAQLNFLTPYQQGISGWQNYTGCKTLTPIVSQNTYLVWEVLEDKEIGNEPFY